MSYNQKLRPTTGKLLYNGKVILENKPFPILQSEKKRLIAAGFKKELFKLTY